MGGIGSFTPGPQITPPPSPMMPTNPTPAAPGNTPPMQQPKPPMSGGIFGAPMFAAGGDTDLPNKGLEALDKVAPKVVDEMGFNVGGNTDMMQDPLVQDTILFILGKSENDKVVAEFVDKYGTETYLTLRDAVLKQTSGNPNVQTAGLIQGNGNS